jgi:K+-transporting ATPase KdpF subunit
MTIPVPLAYVIAHITGADFFGLVVSVIVIAYLFYALIRGDRL